jgi:hypothetical protein
LRRSFTASQGIEKHWQEFIEKKGPDHFFSGGDKKLPMRAFLAKWEKKFVDGNVVRFPEGLTRLEP